MSTSNNIDGFEVCSNEAIFEDIIPVIKNWINNVTTYSEYFKDKDACWWYNERANIGILAAAAWQTQNWLSLEEYQTLKHGIDKDQRIQKNGRCDLFLLNKNKNISYAIEAKVAWQNMGKGLKNKTRKSKEMFTGAWKDAGNLLHWESDYRIAACFINPMLPKSEKFETSELQAWIQEVKTKLSPDMMAWVFPESSRRIENSDIKKIFPGVCVCMKLRQRANKMVS